MKIYIDGKYYDQHKATVSVFDHGLLYGDGVFEGIRAYHGRVFKLAEHIERLFCSAKAILLTIPLTPEGVARVVVETCRKNKLRDGYIRLLVTRGTGSLGLNPLKCTKPSVIIIADKIQLYPAELYQRGLDLVTVPTVRNLHSALNPAIKSLNYLNNILAKIEALHSGCEEAIMLNAEGYVAECSGDNIFMVKGGDLLTPPLSASASLCWATARGGGNHRGGEDRRAGHRQRQAGAGDGETGVPVPPINPGFWRTDIICCKVRVRTETEDHFGQLRLL